MDAESLTIKIFCPCVTKKTKGNGIAIQICWDADRLDLPRVGIIPDVKFLNSLAGKEMAG